MKKSPPRILIYLAYACAILVLVFLYVIVQLNFQNRQGQRQDEINYYKIRTLLTQLRINMVDIGTHQDNYLIVPNSKDSLDLIAYRKAAKQSIRDLYINCRDSLVTCSEIAQLDTLLVKSLVYSEAVLRTSHPNRIPAPALFTAKQENDRIRADFYTLIDGVMVNGRNRVQEIHDRKDDVVDDRNRVLSIGVVVILLVLLNLIYLVYRQLNQKNRLLKKNRIFDNAGDGILVTDENFRVNSYNNKIAELLKRKETALDGASIWELMPSLTSQVISEKVHRSFAHQKFQVVEIYHEPVSAWLRISIYPFAKGLSLAIKDINEIKHTETELYKSKKLYEFISRSNDLILHAGSEEEIYPAICELAIDSGDFLFAWAGKPDDAGIYMQPFCSAGNHSEYLKNLKIGILDVPEGQGPSGKAYRLAKYYYCNDIAGDPAMKPWRSLALAHGFRSSIALPVIVEGRVVAVMTFYAPEAFFFTEDQLHLMERVMDNISFALTAFESVRKRREAEQQLQIVNQAIEQSHASVVITDNKGAIQYVNPAFTELTGYTMDDVYAENPRVLKTGYTTDDDYTDLWKEISAGRVWQGEFLNKKKNGETYWESATISPILDKEGVVTHYVAVKENITVRKKLEAARQQLLRMFENTSAFMGTCDMNRNFLYGNQALKDALEIGTDDITQFNIDDFRPAGGKAYMQEVYDTLFKTGMWQGENTYVSRSGKEIPVMQVVMLHKEEGNPAYISSTAIDLSRVKEAEKELVRLNNELRNFTNHLQYIRETEKNTIAKEVHDELGQGLAALKMDVAWIKRHLDDGKENIAAKLDILLQSISEKLHAFNKIYLSANTAMIDEIGLEASIQYQADLFTKNHQIPVSFHSNMNQERIRLEQGLNLYRILVEGLANISKHANATHVEIELRLENDMLYLTIHDNGKGFEYNRVDRNKHHGLVEIRERVLAMKGKLFINSQINEGTSLTIQVKIEKKTDK